MPEILPGTPFTPGNLNFPTPPSPVQHPPSVAFFDSAIGKAVKVALYSGISAALATVLAAITQNPVMFGPYTMIINTALALVVKMLDPQTPTLPR